MRALWLTGIFVASLAAADDPPVAPRAKPSDYPVHAATKSAVLAAAIVPPDQVKKMLSGELNKRYIVIEVAIYPNDGQTFNVDRLDFALRAGDQVLHPGEPRDPTDVWKGKNDPLGNQGPNVTAETGVIVDRSPDPVTGRQRTGVGTYEGVAVSNYPRPNPPAPPPPRSNPNQTAAAEKAHDLALPQGITGKPAAGYLYFPRPRGKHDSLTLNHEGDDVSVDLKFPK